jgi:hypothetical protein
MERPGDAASTGRVSEDLALEVRSQDARWVAERVFQDFELSDGELGLAGEALAGVGGGAEFQRILMAAAKKPGGRWDSISQDRRQTCLSSAMTFHCSPADMERMALRTAAALFLTGSPDLGRKIIEAAPDSAFGTEKLGTSMVLTIGQACLYAVMIAIIAIQSIASGFYLYLVPGLAAVAVAALMLWLVERGKMKLKREEGEARRYLVALGRLTQGAAPTQVFAPDGTLAGSAPV